MNFKFYLIIEFRWNFNFTKKKIEDTFHREMDTNITHDYRKLTASWDETEIEKVHLFITWLPMANDGKLQVIIISFCFKLSNVSWNMKYIKQHESGLLVWDIYIKYKLESQLCQFEMAVRCLKKIN